MHARQFKKNFMIFFEALVQVIGKGLGKGVDAWVELGRWAHSTSVEDQAPSALAARARMQIVSSLPDRYASESRVQRVCDIMLRQWKSVRSQPTFLAGGLGNHPGTETV